MKKLLSMILIICLILGAVPAAPGEGTVITESVEKPSASWFTLAGNNVFDGTDKYDELYLESNKSGLSFEAAPDGEEGLVMPGSYSFTVYVYGEEYEEFDEFDMEYGAFILTVPFKILPAPLTVTGLTVSDHEYDGGTTAAIVSESGPEFSGTLAEGYEDVSISGTPAGEFEDANVGENKNVALSGLELTGEDAKCYTLSGTTLTGTITPRPVTVTARDREVTSTDDIDLTLDDDQLSGALEGHTLSELTLTAATDELSAENPEVPIVPSGAKIQDASGTDVTGNYSISYSNGKLKLTSPPEVISHSVTFVVENGSWTTGRRTRNRGSWKARKGTR